MKVAPIISQLRNRSVGETVINYSLVHTGQHYDRQMSGSFFEALNIPEPSVNLNAHGSTPSKLAASILNKFDDYLSEVKTDLVLVVGDVTSTLACAICAKMRKIDVAHVEAGIRSNDWMMPEEINRLVTDSITNYFFTTSRHANENLKKAGVNTDSVFFVGNCMVDTLLSNRGRFKRPEIWGRHKLIEGKYFILTLHRPSNVDSPLVLKEMLRKMLEYSHNFPIVFPVHPRTRKTVDSIGINDRRLIVVEPMDYLEFNYLVENSLGVITDSGGITEEATMLNVPCLTMRETTERPETVEVGTNILIGNDYGLLSESFNKIISGQWKKGSPPELWDGRAAERIVDKLSQIVESQL